MNYSESPTFGAIDYCAFAVMLTVSLGIGVITSFKGNKSSEDFLMGDRAFSPLPVAMSLVTSFVSAISLLGFSGEAYANGLQISLFVIGMVLGIAASGIFIIPVLFPLRITSVNEYLELRFKSPNLRKTVTAFMVVKGLLYMGICLYAPTIALATVTPLSSHAYIFILGVVVTFYSTIGGIRAVIWTDVFQLTVMAIGLVVIFVIGIIDAGGPTQIFDVALAGGRLNMFNMDPSIYVRHNFYNAITFGFFLGFSFCGVSQINVQRICAVKNMKDSKRVMGFTAIGMIVIYFFIFGGGIVAYAAYEGCDPMARGIIGKKEEIIPFYVVDRLSFATGLPGLFVATIIGGALSSLSSVMNALVAMMWKDFFAAFKIFQDIKPQTAGIINKILSVVIGIIVVGGAILASKGGSLIEFTNSVTSVVLGSTAGVFLLGLYFPKVNVKGVWTGFAFATLLLCWISGGTFFYKTNFKPLPVSDANCPSTVFNVSDINVNSTVYNLGQEKLNSTDTDQDNSPLMYLYGISYTLYTATGAFCCVLVALLFSLCTGHEDLSEVNPKYVSKFVRKFYWTDKELEIFNLREKTLKMDSANGCNGVKIEPQMNIEKNSFKTRL